MEASLHKLNQNGIVGRLAVLHRLRWTTTKHYFDTEISTSRLRTYILILFGMVFWAALYLLFRDGFYFLKTMRMISGPLIELLFGIFFSTLTVMILFSSAIMSYSSLLYSKEAEFLLVRPIPADRIYAYKLQEIVFYSTWGFLLIGSPLAIAYGNVVEAPLVYYLFSIPFFVAFSIVPSTLGATFSLLIATLMPTRGKHILISICSVALIGIGIWVFQQWSLTQTFGLSEHWLRTTLDRLNLFRIPFLPGSWIGKGILYSTYQDGLNQSILLLFLLIANAAFLYLVSCWSYYFLYRKAYNKIHSHGNRSVRNSGSVIDWVFDWITPYWNGPKLVLLKKDVTVFCRDPKQWIQTVLFICLFIMYFVSARQMHQLSSMPFWRTTLGFFNVAFLGLLMAGFMSRFIFPLLSLEGRNIWTLGLAPISRDSLVWGKFVFSCTGSILFTVPLLIAGGAIMEQPVVFILLHLYLGILICVGVSGISVGLGARFIETKSDDPTKIAAGYGGTVNLVTTLLYLIMVLSASIVPFVIKLSGKDIRQLSMQLMQSPTWEVFQTGGFIWSLVLGMICSLIITGVFLLVPMRLGMRYFRNLEF